MDAKKKRNKKKKGNPGKNNTDAVSNAGEAAPQRQNHESAPKDHHNGADTDDAMSSVGEVVPQYQNHDSVTRVNHNSGNTDDAMSSVGEVAPQYQNNEPVPQVNQKGGNADDAMSCVGKGVPCDQNHEPAILPENCKGSNTLHADQMSVGVSESSVELNIQRCCEAKFEKLCETIKQLEDEKISWLQKVCVLESELEKLQNKVRYHVQNEALLEGKLNSLQNGYDTLVEKEAILNNKVSSLEDIKDSLTQQEICIKERVTGLEEANKALQVQVKVLEESSNNTIEENWRLVKNLGELESRIQILEVKTILNETSTVKEVSEENKMMDLMDLRGPLLQQKTGFVEISKGNELIAGRGQSGSVAVSSDNNHSQGNSMPSKAYTSSHLEETSLEFPETARVDGVAQDLGGVNVHQGSTQEFDELRMSEDIVPVPMDDIQIHEDGPPEVIDEMGETSLSDAPLIGAPFRLFSFVSRYISGADLVNQNNSPSASQAA